MPRNWPTTEQFPATTKYTRLYTKSLLIGYQSVRLYHLQNQVAFIEGMYQTGPPKSIRHHHQRLGHILSGRHEFPPLFLTRMLRSAYILGTHQHSPTGFIEEIARLDRNAPIASYIHHYCHGILISGDR